MTDQDYSETAFYNFLRQGALAGVIRPATARSRKLAAEQLRGQLKANERMDLRQLDVDELCSRFHKLQGSTIRPETLQIHNQRLKAGLKDFISWTGDPAGFISLENELPDAQLVAARDTPGQARAREELVLNPPRSPFDILPIKLRPELVVYIQNIPLDLTPQEAQKIAAVIQALAVPAETGDQ